MIPETYMDHMKTMAQATLQHVEHELELIRRNRAWLKASERQARQDRKEAQSTLKRIEEVRGENA